MLTFSLRRLGAENLKEQICVIYIMTPREVVTDQSWRDASVGFNIPLYSHALLYRLDIYNYKKGFQGGNEYFCYDDNSTIVLSNFISGTNCEFRVKIAFTNY